MSTQAEQFFDDAAAALRAQRTRPYGPPHDPAEGKIAGQACVALCAGNADQARTLWKLVVADLGANYMPHAACVALIRAANTTNLVPDVEAPEPS